MPPPPTGPPREGAGAARPGGRDRPRPFAGRRGDPPVTTEQLHDVRLHVNGSVHEVRVPARRLLSDALRHDCGLTGTHVGCEHGVCGACTVLVDGTPMRSCLMLAVSAVDAEITTVEGLTEDDGSAQGRLSPVQQAFSDCHGLQCGFCTPGFLTTITAGLRETPDPTEDEAREMIAGNLCRCTGYQNIVKSVLRASEIVPSGSGERMTTKMFGAKVPRVEDQRFLRGQGRYVDDLLHRRPAPAALRRAALAARPRAHRRHRRLRRARPRGRAGRVDVGRPHRSDGRAAAAAHPAPDPDPRPHAVRAGQGRGQLRRRGDRLRRRRRPLRRRGRRVADPRRLRLPPARRRHRRRPRGDDGRARRRARQRRRPDGAGERRRPRGHRRRRPTR